MSILILHTRNASRRRHFARVQEYARQHGERVLLILKNPTWESDFVDRVAIADTSSITETVAAARELVADEQEPVRAVLAFVEHSVPAAAAVAADLGLPFVSEHTARVARDKYAMRQAFEAEGVPQPGFGLARTVEEARTVAEKIGFPLVMKPLIGGGSMYVRRVNDAGELAEHFNAIRQGSWEGFDYDPLYASLLEQYGGALLLEGYVPGSEISVESMVFDGQTTVVAIHDKPLPMNGPFFEEILYATPTQLAPNVVARIRDVTTAAHRALGVQVGATHTEYRIRSDGEPVILETAARLGGGPVYPSVLFSTGVDMLAGVLDLALGRKPNLTPRPELTHTGAYTFFAEKAGRVRAVHGVDDALADPHVKELLLYRKAGDEVNVPPHVWQAHGHVIFTAGTREELMEVFDRLAKTIRYEVE